MTWQDHEGVLSAPLAVCDGVEEESGAILSTLPPQGPGLLAREDFAELVVQAALRLGREQEEV
jgi:hypothetical protein